MDRWAIVVGIGVIALAAVRELVRWRGRRWQRPEAPGGGSER